MVRPGLSAAAEERQRKLQEYLAAKGKLKCQNTKPYLKAKNNCPNPPPSKSTIGPKKDVTNHVALPVKTTRSISIKLQSRPANITRSQRPKLEPPKLGKRLTSESVSSNPNGKPPGNSQQLRGFGSSTDGKQPRKTMGSLNIQKLKTTKQQVTDQRTAKGTDPVDNTHVENESLGGCLKEMNKENLPQDLPNSERKPNPESWTINKPQTNQTKSSLASTREVLDKSSVNSAALKEGVIKPFVEETQISVPPGKSQKLSRVADLIRPGGKPPKTLPSHFVQTLNRTQATKKTVVKDIKSIKVNRSKYERPNEAKLQSYTVTEQKVKHSKPSTHPSVLQGGCNHRHPNIKQDHKPTQACCRPQTSYALQKSKAISQRPNLTVGSFNSVIPSTPSIRANGATGNKCNNSCQQRARTLDSKFKSAPPQKCFLNKTAPRTQAGGPTISGRGVPNGAQTNPCKKIAAEDRRKQLEEWRKSKGKIYKRPPMELKTKRKIIEEMNISFWKSMEKEEEEKKAQLELSNKINNTLTECLQLIERPIQELREVVLNILQDRNRTTEGMTSNSLVAETNITSIEELAKKTESGASCLSPKESEQMSVTPQITKSEQDGHPGIKLQIAPIPRINGMPEVQDMKLITPVRRSARIERAVSRYPEMLQEHDLVVASLNELLEVEETECFIFRKNEALPVTLGFPVSES
uniref:Cytoskeleton associated protein 2 like n=1 Tax=Bos indicus x Bos taurus TaxID=30522 RepID=A0A4W2FTS4_BOBOX